VCEFVSANAAAYSGIHWSFEVDLTSLAGEEVVSPLRLAILLNAMPKSSMKFDAPDQGGDALPVENRPAVDFDCSIHDPHATVSFAQLVAYTRNRGSGEWFVR
jgi:hypothetical protein